MTVVEFYRCLGIDANEVLKRLRTEELVKKYLKKFAEDATFDELKKNIEEQDAEKAFMAAHTLKGICLNLELKPLSKASVELTELLRDFNGDWAALKEKFEKLQTVYEDAVKNIGELN